MASLVKSSLIGALGYMQCQYCYWDKPDNVFSWAGLTDMGGVADRSSGGPVSREPLEKQPETS